MMHEKLKIWEKMIVNWKNRLWYIRQFDVPKLNLTFYVNYDKISKHYCFFYA